MEFTLSFFRTTGLGVCVFYGSCLGLLQGLESGSLCLKPLLPNAKRLKTKVGWSVGNEPRRWREKYCIDPMFRCSRVSYGVPLRGGRVLIPSELRDLSVPPSLRHFYRVYG